MSYNDLNSFSQCMPEKSRSDSNAAETCPANYLGLSRILIREASRLYCISPKK